MGRRVELQLSDEMPRHEREWKIKRVCWAGMALLLSAGLMGLLGSGPLSSATLISENGLQLKYDKVARFEAPSIFELTIPAGKEPVSIALNDGFLVRVQIERIEPTPAEMALADGKHVWTFRRLESNEKSKLRVVFRPVRYGRVKGEIGVQGFGFFQIQSYFLP